VASIYKAHGKWQAQVRRAGQKSISRTFDTKAEAERWTRSIEHRADAGHAIGGTKATVRGLIEAYAAARLDTGRAIGRQSNTHFMHEHLKRGLGDTMLGKLDTQALVAYARARRRHGAGAYTVYMEISALGTALRYACSLLNIPYHDPLATARPTMHHLGLIKAQGGKRERRPTNDEWPRLLEALAAVSKAVPMVDIVELAARSTLRRGEICRLLWADLDVDTRTILVRQRKHPRQKETNDEIVPLVGDALDIILRQPRRRERIFPFSAQGVSKLFTKARKAVGITDLRLHDMRHEGTSRLFEAGWGIPEVATVTGHKSWTHLRRYTNLDPAEIAKKPVRKQP
jgi:integrase